MEGNEMAQVIKYRTASLKPSTMTAEEVWERLRRGEHV
jgi:hypothetical protein